MRNLATTALLVGALAAVPVVGHAATAGLAQATSAAKPASSSTHAVATHATRGIVKSMDANTLVITRAGKKPGEMTFALNSSTHRDGTIAVGSPVSVRYQQENKTDVAVAITAQPARGKATHTRAAAK